MLEKTKDRHIKGECQLTDLAKGIEFITQKFDEYEKDRREKDALIATLQNELKSASMKIEDLEMQKQEQYSRRNSILVHGLKEEMMERTDDRVLKLFKDKLNEDVLSADLDRTHRIGKKSDSSSKPRPVIVKFARYNIREKVFKSKKNSRVKVLAFQKVLLGTE